MKKVRFFIGIPVFIFFLGVLATPAKAEEFVVRGPATDQKDEPIINLDKPETESDVLAAPDREFTTALDFKVGVQLISRMYGQSGANTSSDTVFGNKIEVLAGVDWIYFLSDHVPTSFGLELVSRRDTSYLDIPITLGYRFDGISLSSGSYFFIHAGIFVGLPLDELNVGVAEIAVSKTALGVYVAQSIYFPLTADVMIGLKPWVKVSTGEAFEPNSFSVKGFWEVGVAAILRWNYQ